MGLSSNEFLLGRICKKVPFLFYVVVFIVFFVVVFFLNLFSHLLSFSCFPYVLFSRHSLVFFFGGGGRPDFTGERGSLFEGISLMKMSQYY